MYEYQAVVNRVIDGDTIEVSVDLGFSVRMTTPLRMFGINAPELHSKDATERKKAIAARDYLETLIDGKLVTVKTAKPKDKYGRYLAEVFQCPGLQAKSVNQLMIDAGYAKYWDGSGEKP